MQQEADLTDHEKLIGFHIFTIAQYRLSPTEHKCKQLT